MTLLWWHWVALGLGLALLELALFSFFVIWFALGAVLTGIVLLALPGLGFVAQMLLWTIASVAMTIVWFKYFRNASRTRAGQADEALGESGVLVRAIEPLGIAGAASGRGEVRFQKPVMGADVWPCIADEAIAVGARVKVVAVDGQLLKVCKS
jgi:membrane protein implicated in regulation of membrane protease activity